MDQAERHENAGLENDGLIMAAAGMAIIFYLCILLLFYFVGTDKRPAMGSHPNLASRSEVVSIYKFGTQKIKFWTTPFATTSALDTAYARNETLNRKNASINRQRVL